MGIISCGYVGACVDGRLRNWEAGCGECVQLQRGIFLKSMFPLFALLSSSDDRPGLSFSNYQNTPAPPES